MYKKIFLLILAFTCCLASLAHSHTVSGATTIEDKATLPILTPSFEDRKTLKIQLENGLQAYLISDPNTDKSAAALVVKTGSWEDPKDYSGIAHFLEHMLFLGTKKYPVESEYDRFISEHNGQSNAFTSNDFTGYVFTVNNNAFPEALDRFAQFFIAPLFNPSGVDRELQAIDQEYAKNIEDDDIREYYIGKALANPNHPNRAFSMGNRSSLLKVSQDTLKKWYAEHYSANRMRLEVISSLPLDQLETLVINEFSPIVNKNLPPLAVDVPLIADTMKGRMVYIEPVKNVRRLMIIWELPTKFAAMRDTKPEVIVGAVLGHEGKKSLLAQLKKEKLAEGLQAGGEKIGGTNFEFYLQIDLTDAGVKDVNTVILRCFQAIANFKEKGVPNYLFDEVHTMSVLNYEFQPKEEAFNHIIAEAMYLPNEEIATYPEQTRVLQKFDPAAVMDLLAFLTPQNAVFDLIAPKSLLSGITFDQNEPWLNIAYTVKPVPQETMNTWKTAQPNPQIDLPEPNPYIPEDAAVITRAKVEDTTDGSYIPHPTTTLDNDRGKIYFAQDTRYNVPKVSWSFEIKTPAVNPTDAESAVLADLFIKYANEALSPLTYPATAAGLNFVLQPSENGLSITIDGFSDKATDLFLDVLKTIKDLRPREQKFKVFKDILIRQYQDMSLESPLTQDYELLRSIEYKNFITSKAKCAALRKVNFDRLDDFASHLFDKAYIEGFIYGNVDEKQARTLTGQILQTLASAPYPKQEQIKREVIVLPQDQGPFFVEIKSKVQGNALILAIELDQYSFKARAAQQILMQAIRQPFFADLRTKQQTGYIVFSMAEELEQHLFDTFAVQSNTHEGRDLLARFEQFIENFLQEMTISEVTANRFDSIKQSLLTTLKQPPQSMTEMLTILYKLAFTYNGDFDRITKRIQAMDDLTYDEFVSNSRKVLGKTNKRRLAVIFTGIIPENESLKYDRLPTSMKIGNYPPTNPPSRIALMSEHPQEPLWMWIGFNAFVLILITLDLFVLHRHNKVISVKKALQTSACWISLALCFNLFIWWYRGSQDALNFLAGYLIEESLSVDNLFVFILIFDYFRTPKEYQHKVLFWGILGAIVMRAVFIFFGIALIHKFAWIFYVFGLFLIYAAIKMVMPKNEGIHPENNFVIKTVKRFIPITPKYHKDHFFTKIDGRLWATPLFVVLLTVETTDLIFAIDSIPAVMGITLDPFIIYTSNIFAILGLRALYFALAGIMPLFQYLKYGLAAILVFVGLKMLLAGYFHVPIGIALGFIVVALGISIAVSILKR